MHFHVEVIVPAGAGETEADALTIASKMMAPYLEDEQGNGEWDWWMVGGRYRGAHISEDTVIEDLPQIKCEVCKGTGTRPDGFERFGSKWMKWTNGCNGCDGKGSRLPWPTQWPPHPRDVARNHEVRTDLTALAYVDETGWHYIGGSDLLSASGGVVPRPESPCWLVTMDCHS